MKGRSHTLSSAAKRSAALHHGGKTTAHTAETMPNGHHGHRPKASESHTGTRHGVLLFVLLIAQLMVILDITAVNVALPHIATDLHLSGSRISWTITSYSLIFGSLLLFGGRAADLLGRRRMFLMGLGIFTTASFASAMASTAATLFAARAGQGLGAAILPPRPSRSSQPPSRELNARRRLRPGAQSAERERQSVSSSAAFSPRSRTGGRSSTSTSPSRRCCSSPR
jgi:Major Facilitator Superfamily